ncbi:hypothetical protein [Sphingomonas sp.]|uniref:hypothetical protein n=1 Tax=Sphingomonas sp. TaxID=28214 RepID=UPI003B00947B
MRETDRCTIDLETLGAEVLVVQRWQYVWAVQPPLPAWTLAQEQRFHARAEAAIRASWDNRARVQASGTTELAKQLAGHAIPVRIDLRWVTRNPHWTVTVTKVPPALFVTSSVLWDARTIIFDTNDLTWRNAASGEPGMNQRPVSHEFGHAFGNTAVLGRGDEYPASSPHNADTVSIMNHGNSLRARHFTHVINELNQMSAGTTFSVGSIT